MKLALALMLSASSCLAVGQTPADPCPTYVPYSCKSFAEKSAIAHEFLAQYERARKFDTADETEVHGRNNMAIAGTIVLRKADVAILSTINAPEKDPELRWPMLTLWIELFAAIDEGRVAERAWSAALKGPAMCIIDNEPLDENNAEEMARHKAFEEKNERTCAHTSAATGLKNEDRTASMTFNFMVFGNKLFKPADRERYTKMVDTSGLPQIRREMLLACFDHAGNRSWEPGELYPDVPPSR